MSKDKSELPLIMAGPILRRIEPDQLVFWLAVTRPVALRLDLFPPDGSEINLRIGGAGNPQKVTSLQAGEHLHYLLVDINLATPLPSETRIGYELFLKETGTTKRNWLDVTDLCPHLLYDQEKRLTLEVPGQVDVILHGSCRKPHYDADDGLVAADQLMDQLLGTTSLDEDLPMRPSLMLMSGDQIYADDVAGPMLKAIHDVIRKLGLFGESFREIESDQVNSCRDLYDSPKAYYNRLDLLPTLTQNRNIAELFLGGVRKPVFTTDTAENHLITLAEHLAMYLLVWSPIPWQLVEEFEPQNLTDKELRHFRQEDRILKSFRQGLERVQRLFAHVSTAMIFDDHDISDDWNLNREWEEAVYNHSFSRRMVGNGLMAYLVNQGWGNSPEKFSPELMQRLADSLKAPGTEYHDGFIDELLRFQGWDYVWDCQPALVVLDTRTRRWRSESSRVKPSGLLDWEAVTDLQQTLYGRPSVILVSSGPIFGVKLIETIQHFFTLMGKPLLVDAENWMGYPGTAEAILNVFMHSKTPQNFVILSGDVHYSFVYDVELRRHEEGPDIWQICSSGLKNEFPRILLRLLDIANRWLYAPNSPLNWFTRRRRMRVIPRRPDGLANGRRVLNGAGIGLVELDKEGRPWRIRQILADGSRRSFHRMEDHSHYR